MPKTSAAQKHPDVTPEQRATNDLVKRVRKLRWMGMDEEARHLQISLCGKSPADTVLGGPQDTD